MYGQKVALSGKQICIPGKGIKGVIKQSVAESTAERIVVVTHHLPTMVSAKVIFKP